MSRFNYFWFLSFISTVYSNSYYVDKRVEIVDCESSESVTANTDISKDIECAVGTSKDFKLGTKAEVFIHSVTFTEKFTDMKAKLCKKIENGNYKIKRESNVKSIVYSKDTKIKALLAGADDNACATSVLVSDEDLKKAKLIVKSIKCIKKEILPALSITATDSNNLQYKVLGNHFCFLGPMLHTEFKTKATIENKQFDLTISFNPIQECPLCSPPPTPQAPLTKQESNSTQASAASSAGMIAGIIVAVLVVVLGGIGFVMMKK